MQPCSKQVQHTAQETSGSYYSRTKPKENYRASLFHSTNCTYVIVLLEATVMLLLAWRPRRLKYVF